MDSLLQGLRIALRRFWSQPIFGCTAVLTLALGIGANTAIFSVFNAVLLRPLPYADPDRLALLWEVFPDSAFAQIPSGEINLPVWQEPLDSIRSLASFKWSYRSITEPGEPRRVTSWSVSWNLFATLGLPPMLGRNFQIEDGQLGAAAVVILSHGIWEDQFGKDPDLVGSSIWLDGVPHTIVGILARELFFPPPLRILGGTHELAGEIFVPQIVDSESPDPRRNLALLGRLAAGKTWADAAHEIKARAARVARTLPDYNPAGLSSTLAPLHQQAVAEARQGLFLMALAVALILLIACLNVANLLLARGAALGREVAVRSALGASRKRLLRQQMTESLLLAVLGGAVGTVLAYGGTQLLVGLTRDQIPQLGTVDFSPPVLFYCWSLSLLTSLLFGLIPALRISRSRTGSGLFSSRNQSASLRPGLRAGIVIAEVALATVLLVVAGLLSQSLWKLHQVRLGFEPENVLTFSLLPPENRYPEERQVQQLMRDLRMAIAGTKSISAVGAISGLPLSGDREGLPVEIEGRPTVTLKERLDAMTALRFVTPGYFATLQIPFLAGRDVQEQDREGSPPVVIVDRSFVNRFFPAGNAVGSRIAFEDDLDPNRQWRKIVGVVEDVKQESLHREPLLLGTVYTPFAHTSYPQMTIVTRSRLSSEVATREVMQRIRQVDALLAIEVEPLQNLVNRALAQHRSPTLLLTSLASLSLVLAVVGLYGVISFVVVQRTQEIGIRIALGATSHKILGLVVSQTSRWIMAGILIGFALSLASTRILSGLLFEVAVADLKTFLGVATLFLLTAFFATWLPARRATRIDPATALRAE